MKMFNVRQSIEHCRYVEKRDSSGVLLAFFMIVSRPTHGLRVAHEVPIEQEMPKIPGGVGGADRDKLDRKNAC